MTVRQLPSSPFCFVRSYFVIAHLAQAADGAGVDRADFRVGYVAPLDCPYIVVLAAAWISHKVTRIRPRDLPQHPRRPTAPFDSEGPCAGNRFPFSAAAENRFPFSAALGGTS